MKLFLCSLVVGLIFGPLSSPLLAETSDASQVSSQTVSLPSAAPSGLEANDRIWFDFYPALQPAGQKSPAVILIHYLGSTGGNNFQDFARYLHRRGIATARITLPYHGRRKVEGEKPVQRFVGDADKVAQAFTQSASDVSTVVTWLTQQPSVDAQRIGAVGVSLGAQVVHLAMGKDERISAGVAALGAGNFANNWRGSLANRFFIKPRITGYNAEDTAKLNTVDPLTYANKNLPRRVLMIQAARDAFLPPQYAQELWEALGKPPIQWLDINHTGLSLGINSLMKTAAAYLETAWSNEPSNLSNVPRVRVPTLKAGFLTGLDSKVTPAVQWQFFSVGTRRHMGLIGANVGWSGRGPFVSVATPVNQFIDVGVARRFSGDKIRPYASFHIVY